MNQWRWDGINVIGVLGLMAAFLAVGAGTDSLEAQTRFVPQIGVYSNVADPGSVRGASGAYDIGRHESSTVYGGSVDFGAGRGLSFRIGGLFAPDAVPLAGDCLGDCEADLFSATGSFAVRPFGNLLFFEPYMVAGAGVQRFQSGAEGFGDQVTNVFEDGSVWVGVLGIGAEVDLGGPTVLLELVDHFHRSRIRLPGEERDRIDDFYFTVGLSLGG